MTVFGVSATIPGETPTEWAATYQKQRAEGARGCFIYTPQGSTPDTRRLATVPLTDVVVFSPKTCNAATAKTLVDGCPKRTGNVYMVFWQEWLDDMSPEEYRGLADDFLSGWDDQLRPDFVKSGYATWWDLSTGRGAQIAAGIPEQATHVCWSVFSSLLLFYPKYKLDEIAAFMAHTRPDLTWGVASCGVAGGSGVRATWADEMVRACATHNVPYALWFDRDYPQGKGNFSLAANPAAQAAWYGR